MGKISDALERQKKESTLKAERIPVGRPDEPFKKEPETPPAKKILIPSSFNHKLVVVTAPDSFEAENFKLLRAQIMFKRDRKKSRTIMVTSAIPGEGKTFVAANLAVSIALGIDEHVLLVDCDLRRPDLHKMFGLSNAGGLREYLSAKKDLSDLLVRTSIDKLSLLTAGKPPHNPSELLASETMKSFLEEIRDRYEDRFIIIDTAPSQVLTEANVLSNFVDGIIFVIKDQVTPREPIQKAIENLGKDKILGLVYNGYSEGYKSYGRYYKSYYQ